MVNVPTPDLCPHDSCQNEVPIANVNCVVCGRHVSYPNVRFASRIVEAQALEQRVSSAFAAAGITNGVDALLRFRAAVADSKAVIARPPEVLDYIASSKNQLISTYYHMTEEGGSRIPELNEWDPARDRNDSTINPHYYRELHYAALSLDGLGVGWFGACYISLKESAIVERSSVFEENGFSFNAKWPTHSRGVPDPGFRAPWSHRSDLAVAKLHSKIMPDMDVPDFPAILIERDPARGDTDFIEVHVYGPLHPKAFESVQAALPDDELDRAIWERTKRKLEKSGVTVTDIPSD